MNYGNGTQIHVGDIVKYSDGSMGKVVVSLDDHEYSDGYPETQWSFLEEGLLVFTEKMGVVHYPSDLEIDFELSEKSGAN